MKKLIRVLAVVLIILALVVAGAVGFLWYRNNHIFIDDAVYPIDSVSLDLRGEDISIEHYESLRSQLPGCEVAWDVPFQGVRIAWDTQSLTVKSLTEEDVALMEKYFPNLKQVDALACHNYPVLERLKECLPQLEVAYQVDIGGTSYGPETTELVLSVGSYDFVTMMENLQYLPNVTAITLRMPELTQTQIDELRSAYEAIAITCTVEIFRQEYDVETTELDLSAMTSDDVAEVAGKLPQLPNLTHVNLNPESGVSGLSLTDVKTLMEAAPTAVFDFRFDFFGNTLSTADEEVHVKNTRIGDEGLDQVRSALDLLKNCKRFVLENCQISNENMAKLRDDYRDQTKVVWRVSYGKGSTLTDAQIIRAVYDLVDDNCHNLIYCEDARFMDIGHNEWLDSCEFVSGMKSLEYVIISGAPIKDLTPFQNCKNLKVLEAAFCEYIESAEPLRHCTSLERLNISYTHITDLSPLDDLNLVNLCAMYYPKSRVPQEEQERFQALKPDCLMNFVGSQPYGTAWRYDENNDPLPWYTLIREVFRYEIFPQTPNHVGWYLDEEELAMIADVHAAAEKAAAERAAAAKTTPEETAEEETVPEETAAEETVPEETGSEETTPTE